MARLDAKEDLDTHTHVVDVNQNRGQISSKKQWTQRHSHTLTKPSVANISGPFHVLQIDSHFPEITMTVTSDQTLQTHASKFMPIKKKSQKKLKRQKRARALKVDKAWFDRLEVATEVEDDI